MISRLYFMLWGAGAAVIACSGVLWIALVVAFCGIVAAWAWETIV